MPFLRRVAALALLYCLLPGVGELVENTGHLVRYGHLAHAVRADHSHQSAPDPEHGCSTTVHFCSCHASTSFLPPQVCPLVSPDLDQRAPDSHGSWIGSGALADVFRPPRLA